MAKQQNQPTACVKELGKVTEPGRLNQEGIQGDEQLWARIGTNRKEELATLAAKLGVTQKQLLDTLTSNALKEADRHQAAWIKRHTLDLVLLLVRLPVVAIGALIWVRGLHHWKEQEVVAVSNVMPFEPIQAARVKIQPQKHELGAFDDTTRVVGRYSISFIPTGSTLTTSNLSAETLPPSAVALARQGRTDQCSCLRLGAADGARSTAAAGDVVLAFETVRREAAARGKTARRSRPSSDLHGILHLRGHDHENRREAARMEAMKVRHPGAPRRADPYRAEGRLRHG